MLLPAAPPAASPAASPAAPLSPPAAATAPTFTCFRGLPTELRIEVWRTAFAVYHPIELPVEFDRHNNKFRVVHGPALRAAAAAARARLDLLHVNAEARAVLAPLLTGDRTSGLVALDGGTSVIFGRGAVGPDPLGRYSDATYYLFELLAAEHTIRLQRSLPLLGGWGPPASHSLAVPVWWFHDRLRVANLHYFEIAALADAEVRNVIYARLDDDWDEFSALQVNGIDESDMIPVFETLMHELDLDEIEWEGWTIPETEEPVRGTAPEALGLTLEIPLELSVMKAHATAPVTRRRLMRKWAAGLAVLFPSLQRLTLLDSYKSFDETRLAKWNPEIRHTMLERWVKHKDLREKGEGEEMDELEYEEYMADQDWQEEENRRSPFQPAQMTISQGYPDLETPVLEELEREILALGRGIEVTLGTCDELVQGAVAMVYERPGEEGLDEEGPYEEGPEEEGPYEEWPYDEGPEEEGPDEKGPDEKGPDEEGQDCAVQGRESQDEAGGS